MSGRAIILVVVGIIIVSGVILYRIEAASKAITENSVGYLKRQTAQNIAQGGVNISLRQLGYSHTWRTGFSSVDIVGGTASVSLFDTTFMGVSSAIGIRSTGTFQGTTVVSTAFAYFPAQRIPLNTKAVITLNASNSVNGGIVVDGRDHDLLGNVIANNGTYAFLTTGDTIALGGSSTAGGTTSASVDKAPAGSFDSSIIKTMVVFPPPGYPNTPDSVFGGASQGYPEGLLKSIAQSGVAGSQYVTDPARLRYPLSGVTYVELPAGGLWNSAAVSGSGILVVHNSAKNAAMANASGAFNGLLIGDYIYHLHCTLIGGIVDLTTAPSGNVLGNGSASILFSRKAVQQATSIFTVGTPPKVLAWWE